MTRRCSIRELAAVAGVLTVVAVFTLGRQAAHGAFYSDDWSDAAGRFYPPGGVTFGHVMSYFHGNYHYRPPLVLYMPLRYSVLGTHPTLHIAWSIALAVAGATALYCLLRTFGTATPHALMIAALTVVYPWSDSLRLWGSPSHELLSTVLAMGGILVALRAIERDSLRLHALSIGLYISSLLTFELTLPLIAAAGVLYLTAHGWRRARVRWGIDVALMLAGAIWVRTQTNRQVSDLATAWRHGRRIATEGATVAAHSIDPSMPRPHTALVATLAGGVVIAALAVASRDNRESRRWLVVFGAGLSVAGLGWLAFVPADAYYTPTIFGVANRVNGIAGIGLVMSAYGLLGLVTSLVGAAVRPAQRAVPAVTVALGLVLGGTYVYRLERHIDIWQAAARSQRTAVQRLHAAYPTLPHRATVFTTGFPGYETFGVPIFAATWDLNGRVKFLYDDPSITGYPVIDDQTLECGPRSVGIRGTSNPVVRARYGSAYLLNVRTGVHAVPRDRAECERAIGEFPPGPLSVRGDY